MADFLDNILKNLSQETIDMISEMSEPSEAQELSKKFEDLLQTDKAIKMDYLTDEISIRLKHEEKEIKLCQKLLKEATFEQEEAASCSKLLVPATNMQKIQSQLDTYKKMKGKMGTHPNVDICAMVDLHAETKVKKEKIAEIQKRLEKYAGLPPDINKAKDAIDDLTAEIKLLEEKANQKLSEDVSKYATLM